MISSDLAHESGWRPKVLEANWPLDVAIGCYSKLGPVCEFLARSTYPGPRRRVLELANAPPRTKSDSGLARRERLAACVDMVARGKSCATGPDEPVRLPAPEIGDGK